MPDEKSLEMRIAAIEDKLSRMSVSQEEMSAYQKVSALAGGTSAIDVSSQLFFCYVNCVIAIPRTIIPPSRGIEAQQSAVKQGGSEFEKLGR
jgi:hypothetical protein